MSTVVELDNKLEDMEEALEKESSATAPTAPTPGSTVNESLSSEDPAMDASFMSESIYQKLSPKNKKHRTISTAAPGPLLGKFRSNHSLQRNDPCLSYTNISNRVR